MTTQATRNDSLIAQLRRELQATNAFQKILSDQRLEVTGAAVEARALMLAALQDATRRGIAVIVPSDAALDDFESALQLFHRDPRCVSLYPSPSLSPYQNVSPSLGVIREEIRALGMLASDGANIVVVPARALF